MLVSWNTTNECNLECRHCYRDAGSRVLNELNTKEGKALIDDIAGTGFKVMIFSGGEPLMRDDIYELVAHARKRGLRAVMGSNGTLITQKAALRLKECGLLRIGISLDSIDSEKHDKFRGIDGSWQAAVDGMKYCREVDLPFQIHTTVVDGNYDELEKITDFAVSVKAAAHHIFFLVPTGRGKYIEEESLRAIQYEKLLYRILKKQKEVNIELKPTCAPQFMRIAAQMGINMRYTKGCLAGISYCIIDPEGNVQPCAYLNIKAGNVREKPFHAIWNNSKIFLELRTSDYKGSCGTCKYKDICGGCRARAYFYHGDYMGEEPWCLYRGGRKAENESR